jgi:plastocyanin
MRCAPTAATASLPFVTVTAAVTQVNIINFAFSPQAVVIPKGEAVRWTNLEQVIHAATSDTGNWDSGDLRYAKPFSYESKKPGVYPYRWKCHLFMRGPVRVADAAVGPSSLGRVKALFL